MGVEQFCSTPIMLLGAGKGTRTLKLARRNLNPVCLPISSYPHIQFSRAAEPETFTEVTTPKSNESTNSTTSAYWIVQLILARETWDVNAALVVFCFPQRKLVKMVDKFVHLSLTI